MAFTDKPHVQILNPDTFLMIYKNHFTHITGRDGLQLDRGFETATRIIEKLDDIAEEIPIGEYKAEARVFLTGIWYDVRANVNVYLVTQPSSALPFLDTDRVPDNIYGSLFRQAKEAIATAEESEDGQAIYGNLAEYFYTGGIDYSHPINKFYGRAGLFRGLAIIECSRLHDFLHDDTLFSHPESVLDREDAAAIYSYDNFKDKIKNPPRGRYGPGDALKWGIITPDDLREFTDRYGDELDFTDE